MKSKETRPSAVDPFAVPLPADRAFVVQLQGRKVSGKDIFVGRAEHMVSGASARFTDAAELLAFIARVLAPAEPPADPDDADE